MQLCKISIDETTLNIYACIHIHTSMYFPQLAAFFIFQILVMGKQKWLFNNTAARFIITTARYFPDRQPSYWRSPTWPTSIRCRTEVSIYTTSRHTASTAL